MEPIKNLNDQEIVNLLSADDLINHVRRMISEGMGRIEQAEALRPLPPVVLRRMEFEIAEQIINRCRKDQGPEIIRPLRDLERDAIVKAVEECSGNLTEVSRKLGIGRSTLYRKVDDYGLRHLLPYGKQQRRRRSVPIGD